MTEHARLQAVLLRDSRQDGQFVYAVTTTGVYCRPSCSSRQARPENIRFFTVPEAAERAGFRACKRCRPEAVPAPDPQVAAVRRACAAIEAHLADGTEGPPRLEAIAAAAGQSQWHLQRIFKRLVGISPRAYADARRLERLKSGLREAAAQGRSLAGAVYEAGYGSASRVYERSAAELGMTPATYAKGGRGADIVYAIAACKLGLVLVAATPRGICMVSLGDAADTLAAELCGDYPAARIRRDDTALTPWVEACLRHIDGSEPHLELPLDIRGTAFQRRVWQALRDIPGGETRTYSQIAAAIGHPDAVRAVGSACANNPVSLVVPCHRAVRRDGGLGGYRWGLERKKRLLATEQAARAGGSEREPPG